MTVTFQGALRVWARIGFLSFGGPAGQIALMHREIVEDRKWLTEKEYLGALNFCMLLPSPEAMQLATYAGWKLHGVKGGLAADLLFVLPTQQICRLTSDFAFNKINNLEISASSQFYPLRCAKFLRIFERLSVTSTPTGRLPDHPWHKFGTVEG